MTGRITTALLGRAVRLTAWPGRWALPRRTPLRLDRYGVAATIGRNDRGIPWVRADCPDDLYFGAGFAQACDRLWQMDLLRRRALGRLSEIFGRATVEQDLRVRRLAIDRTARESAAVLQRDGRSALERFSAGVNAATRRMARRGGLPPEFLLLRYRPDPWTPLDSIAIVKFLGYDLAKNLRHELFRAALAREVPQYAQAFGRPRYPIGIPVAAGGRTGFGDTTLPTDVVPVPEPEQLRPEQLSWLGRPPAAGEHAGSNVWVVSGRRTATGRPLLANDPHVAFGTPSIWYQIGLRITDRDPGTDAYGITVPGLPGLVAGANRDLAFGITNSTVDTQDLCWLPPDGLPYRWEERAVVHVRGGPPVTVTVAGARGCVEVSLPDAADGERAALFWSGYAATTEIDGCIRLWRARSYPEFREALRFFGVPVLNFAVAGRDGTIALRTAGRVPRRSKGSGLAPAGYDEVAASWREFIDFDDLPEVVDPPAGYLVSANNPLLPDRADLFLTADWAGAYRAPRIDKLVNGTAGVTVADCEYWQRDVANNRAGRVLPHLLAAIAGAPPTDPLTASCYRLLCRWDGRDAADQAAPLVFDRLMEELAVDWIGSRLGTDLAALMPDTPLQVDHLVLDPAARLALGIPADLVASVVPALERTAVALTGAWGRDPAGWRNDVARRIADPHPLARSVPVLAPLFGLPPTPCGTSRYSVRMMVADRQGTIGEGAPWRFVAQAGDDGWALWDVLRHGSSGHPLSPHYDDQTAAHAAGELHRVTPPGRGAHRRRSGGTNVQTGKLVRSI